MKVSQWKSLVNNYLLPHLPDFTFKGSLLYAEPVEWLLRGFSFEPSAWDRSSFYLWAFIQPLYVPSDHVYYLFGKRLGSGLGLRFEEEKRQESMTDLLTCIQQEGIPYLQQIQTPSDVAWKAKEVHPNPADPYVVEAVAYSLILIGQYSQADKEMTHLLAYWEQEAEHDWHYQQMGRVYRVRGALRRAPQEAVHLLEQWRDLTLKNLRLAE